MQQWFFFFSLFFLLKNLRPNYTNNKKNIKNKNSFFFLLIQILCIYSLALELGISYFFGFVQYLPMPELEIFVGTVH
jgi:hypothetical protein